MRTRVLKVGLPIFAVLAALALVTAVAVGRPQGGRPTVPVGGFIQGDPSNSNVKQFVTVSAPPDWAMPDAPSGMEPGDTIQVPPKYAIPDFTPPSVESPNPNQ